MADITSRDMFEVIFSIPIYSKSTEHLKSYLPHLVKRLIFHVNSNKTKFSYIIDSLIKAQFA